MATVDTDGESMDCTGRSWLLSVGILGSLASIKATVLMCQRFREPETKLCLVYYHLLLPAGIAHAIETWPLIL